MLKLFSKQVEALLKLAKLFTNAELEWVNP